MQQKADKKLVVLGSSCVGKSSLVNRIVKQQFSQVNATVGHGIYYIRRRIGLKQKIISITDTAGPRMFMCMNTKICSKNKDGVFLVFDLTQRQTFEYCAQLIAMLKNYNIQCPIILLGNKSDRQDQIVVSQDQIDQFCDKHGFTYFQVSALSDHYVEQAVQFMLDQIYPIKSQRAGKRESKDQMLIQKRISLPQNLDQERGNCCSRGNYCCF